MSSESATMYRTHVEEKLEAAVAIATKLALAGRYDAAEAKIASVERHLSERGAVPRMYAASIAKLGGANAAAKDRPRIRAIFDRLIVPQDNGCPMPQTQEEADRYGQDDAREHARVVRLVGCDPYLWPAEPAGAALIAPAAATTKPKTKGPRRMLPTTLAVVAIALSVVVSLCMVVLFLASGANSTDAKLQQIKWLIVSVVLVQAASIGGSIGLLVFDRGWMACLAGIFPAVYGVGLTVILVKMEW